MWLLIDDQVEQLADPNFPRQSSIRLPGAQELVAHENFVAYFDQDDSTRTLTVLAAVHVARLRWTKFVNLWDIRCLHHLKTIWASNGLVSRRSRSNRC